MPWYVGRSIRFSDNFHSHEKGKGLASLRKFSLSSIYVNVPNFVCSTNRVVSLPHSPGPGDALRGRHERRDRASANCSMAVHIDSQPLPAGCQNGSQVAARLRRIRRDQLPSAHSGGTGRRPGSGSVPFHFHLHFFFL